MSTPPAAGDPLPTVFVVDDDDSVRSAIGRLLRASGLKVSTCASAMEYLDRYDPNVPGCIILDLSMPEIDGLQLQDALVARSNAPPIIFLTGNAGIPDSVQAMKHGAVEFLTKPVDESLLLDAVGKAIDKDRSDRAERTELDEIRSRLARLTPRESEVLICVVAGLLNKQIAGQLGTVEKTIKVHRARMMEKMEVRSVAALVQLVGRIGIKAPAPR